MSEPIPPKKRRSSARRSAPLDINAPSIERHAIDRLLLAVIDGYPDENDLTSAKWHSRRLQRLRAARKALFADEDSSGDASDDEIAGLQMMAIWHHRDKQLESMRILDQTYLPDVKFDKPRSYRQLAAEAAIRIKGEERTDFIDKIRKIFAKKRNHYIDLMRESDDVELMREFSALLKALDGLAKLGIRFIRPGR